MPHVEVDHVLGVGPLHGDGEGFERVEGEGHQAPHCVVDWPPQQARLDLELEQARVPSVEPAVKVSGVVELSSSHIDIVYFLSATFTPTFVSISI